MRLSLHTNVEELSSHRTTPSEEPISIEIRQTDANRIAQATEIFISNNFVLNGPPRYQDSDGDFVVMDNSESYMAAVSDLLGAGKSTMVVLIDGNYKYENVASTDSCVDSADSCTVKKPTITLEGQEALSKVLDSVMDKVRDEIRTEVKRELDARLSPQFILDLYSHCANAASVGSCTRCSRKEAIADEEADCKLGEVTAGKGSNILHDDRSWLNNAEVHEVFKTATTVEEATQVFAGTAVMESEHVTSLVNSFISNELDKSASATVADVPRERAEFSRTEENVSSSSTQPEHKEASSNEHLLARGQEINECNSLGCAGKMHPEGNHLRDSQFISNSNGSTASSMSTVIGLNSEESELNKLNALNMFHSSSKISANEARTDQSPYGVIDSMYTSDNVDGLTTSRICDSSRVHHTDLYDVPSFICVHADCNYADLRRDEVFSHDPRHTIVRPAVDMRVEDLASLRRHFLSKSSAVNAQLSPPIFARPTNKMFLEQSEVLDAEIEHEGEVALVAEIDEGKGTFWKQWTIRNSGTLKWKNVTLELVSHSPNLEPFFCSISLPNSLNVGRTLDAVVWMNGPLDAQPCKAIWRLAMPRDPSANHIRFFGPPLIFQMGVTSSGEDEMDVVINDDDSEGAVSTVLDSDFDVVDAESLSHVDSEDV